MPPIRNSRALSIDSRNDLFANSNLNPPTKKSKKVPKILDGKFFAFVRSDASDVIVAKCCLCETGRKFIHGKYGSTGNFWDHIRRVHPDKLENVKQHVRTNIAPTQSNLGKDEVSFSNL